MRNPFELRRAVAQGLRFLRRHQDLDGHWRDYELEPGRSEAWVTAYTGLAVWSGRRPGAAVRRAADALLRTRREEGWGYNSRTACDADSTSWSIRFLARTNALDGIAIAPLLAMYATPSDTFRTFRSPERFGTWAGEHDEVTPLAGLALVAAGEHSLAARVRDAVLRTWRTKEEWVPFWWATPAYASAQNLEFLAATGGIPEDVAAGESARLLCRRPAGSAIETTQVLAMALLLGLREAACEACQLLLRAQWPDGGWPPSPALLVPEQQHDLSVPPQHFADDRRIFGTAAAVVALRLTYYRSEECDDA